MPKLCPLCGSDNIESYTDHMEHIQLEDFLECFDCGYIYDFHTGHTREVIEGKEFSWTYHDTESNTQREEEAQACFELARKKYECPTCEGRGEVYDYPCPDDPHIPGIWVDCPACEGSGLKTRKLQSA